jgi:HEAT repeat protein
VRLRAVEGVVAILKKSTKDEAALVDALGKSLASDMADEVRLKSASLMKELKKEYLRRLAPVVADALKSDKSASVRVAAAVVLGRTEEHAKTVLATMVDALKDADPTVRANVAESLGRIGDEAKVAIPGLKTLLKDMDASVRLSAVFALGRVGPEAATAAPELIAVLGSDMDMAVRKEAARAFSLLGLDAKAGVAALAKALREDKSEEVRQQAAIALGKMRGETRDAVAAMLEAMKTDKDKTVRVFVIHAMGDSLGDGLRANVKDLADQLIKEPEADVRLALVQELGLLGPAAKDALPALQRAATDVQLSVRNEAKAAVKKVMGR